MEELDIIICLKKRNQRLKEYQKNDYEATNRYLAKQYINPICPGVFLFNHTPG